MNVQLLRVGLHPGQMLVYHIYWTAGRNYYTENSTQTVKLGIQTSNPGGLRM